MAVPHEQEQIDHILDHFDFGKMLEVMRFMGWVYRNGSGDPYYPDESQLRRSARSLLREVAAFEERCGYTGTGGLEAQKWGDVLHLHFSAVNWDGEVVLPDAGEQSAEAVEELGEEGVA